MAGSFLPVLLFSLPDLASVSSRTSPKLSTLLELILIFAGPLDCLFSLHQTLPTTLVQLTVTQHYTFSERYHFAPKQSLINAGQITFPCYLLSVFPLCFICKSLAVCNFIPVSSFQFLYLARKLSASWNLSICLTMLHLTPRRELNIIGTKIC